MTLQMKIDYPEILPDALQKSRDQFEYEAKMVMAIKLFEMQRLSSGLAASLVGLDRVTFLLQLHQYGTVMLDLAAEELLADVEHA
jgi:predicted HTH domain antitoxin